MNNLKQWRSARLLGAGLVALLLDGCAAKKAEESELCAAAKYKGAGTDTSIVDFEDPSLSDVTSTFTNRDNLHGNFYWYGDNYDWGGEDPVWTLTSPGQASNRSLMWTYKSACAADPSLEFGWCYGGLGVGFDECYDASAYAGISLWVKGRARSVKISFLSSIVEGMEIDSGGVCPDSCPWTIQQDISLTDTWTFYEGDFAGLMGGLNGSVEYKAKLASGLDIVAQPADALDTDWEIDLDSVNFIKQ
jgi:hypothetical protein